MNGLPIKDASCLFFLILILIIILFMNLIEASNRSDRLGESDHD